jgi:hypothetical protein
MSSTHVLIVPIIACALVGGIITGLAIWVTIAKMALIRTQDRVASRVYTDAMDHARKTDDLVCELIGEIEHAPATADTLFPVSVQQEIYDAHSRYQELGTARKGIS